MSSHKYIDIICILTIIIALCITIAFIHGKELGIEGIVDEDSESYEGPGYITKKDLDGKWDTDKATKINIHGENIVIDGDGAYVYKNNVVIAKAGKYVVSGESKSSSIIVDGYSSSKVWIMLDGVNLYNEDDACIKVENADKVFLTLNSDSYLESKGSTILSHDDFTINGTGQLYIKSSEGHGMELNDNFVLAGGVVNIDSKEDAIHVNEDVSIVNSTLKISAGDDGITTDGTINIEDANIEISKCYEGIEAPHINIYSGDITIHPEDDGINARFEGIKLDVESYIYVEGGNITIINDTAYDADGFDSNGDVLISGGNIFISLVNNGTNNAIDYGSEVGGICEITGGTVIASGSYLMAEGFDNSSTQASILYTYSDGAKANSRVSLENANGNKVLDTEIPCSFSSIIISSPDIIVGENYSLAIDDNIAEISIEEMAASYGDVQSSKFPGSMNWGGMKPGPAPEGGGKWDNVETVPEGGERWDNVENVPEGGEKWDNVGPAPEGGEKWGNAAPDNMVDSKKDGKIPKMDNQSGAEWGNVAIPSSPTDVDRLEAHDMKMNEKGRGGGERHQNDDIDGKHKKSDKPNGKPNDKPYKEDNANGDRNVSDNSINSTAVSTIFDYDDYTWSVVGGSFFVMIIFIAVVKFYKRRRY